MNSQNIENVTTATVGGAIMENVSMQNGYVMENISVNSPTSMSPMIQMRLKGANLIQVHTVDLEYMILSYPF